MSAPITLTINGQTHHLEVEPETPLLYVLRNDLQFKGAKYGCGGEQCGACKVLVDGRDIPSCQLAVKDIVGMSITTLEGLGTPDNLHPLQETFIEEQAAQCGYCTSGMIIAAQGLLNRTRYPNDDDIREALQHNLCRCGVYDRIRRAIHLRTGRLSNGGYEVITPDPIEPGEQVGLPSSIQQTPDLDAWIRMNADETVTIFSGKVELGQGIKTALTQIVSEELDVSMERIQIVTADTRQSPDEGITAGSMSVEASGGSLRLAGATARHHLLSLAFEQLESRTPAHELIVSDGVITDPETGKQTTYWELMGGKSFGLQVTGTISPKAPETYTVVGQARKRVDLLNKVTGQPAFVHDMNAPDLLHARVIRPPHYHARLVSLEESTILALAGVVAVVRDGSFLAVVAEREEQAIHALQKARDIAVWDIIEPLPADHSTYDDMLTKPTHDNLIVDGAGVDVPIPDILTPDDATQTISATYRKPFIMHGSLGPSAAVAQWDGDTVTIWCPTQGAYLLQYAVAEALAIKQTQVQVVHAEGAGCYGHNGADDVGLDAALIARAVAGRPVSLKWMREDEHRWEPYGSAMILKMQGSLDHDNRIIAWNHDIWSYGHSTRPQGGGGLLSAWYLENPLPRQHPRVINGYHFGSHRNADPLYDFPKRIVRHELEDSPVRVSAVRSLGAYANIFAIESFMDELAETAGIDPLDFRLNHLTDERAKAVLRAAADKASWYERPSGDGRGSGIAFARYKNKQTYCAIVVDVEVVRETGKIHVKRGIIAADSGQAVNPDGLSNQLEGGFVQATSWTLFEQVRWNPDRISSYDWETYPILSFPDAPIVETLILNRPNLPFMGAGEASQNPTPAAIANAVYAAVGIRLRDVPFTPDKVRALLG